MTRDVQRTLPPDPSVPGLWWVRNGDWWRVWAWQPQGWQPHVNVGYWRTGDSSVMPDAAHAGGWRCIAEAVPPGDAP